MAVALLHIRRPTVPIPTDKRHEFLTTWLPPDDECLQRWIAWLKRTRVRHIVRIEYRTRNGHTGPFYMIYTHRMIHSATGRGSAHWCCEED